MKLFATLCVYVGLSVCALGQASITFSVQGKQALKDLTGKVVKNLQLVSAEVCTQDNKPVSGGQVYQMAVFAGYEYYDPKIAPVLFTNASNKNWRVYAVDVMRYATIAGAGLTASGVFSTADRLRKWTTIAVNLHDISDGVKDRLTSEIPNPTPLIQVLIDNKRNLELTQSPEGGLSCAGGIIAVRYDTKNKNFGPMPLSMIQTTVLPIRPEQGQTTVKQ